MVDPIVTPPFPTVSVPEPLSTTVALNPPMVGTASPFERVDGGNRDLILEAIRAWARGPLIHWAGTWQTSLSEWLGNTENWLESWDAEIVRYTQDVLAGVATDLASNTAAVNARLAANEAAVNAALAAVIANSITLQDSVAAGLITSPSLTRDSLNALLASINTIPPKRPAVTMLTRFQAGHGWTDISGGWSDRTDIVGQGYQSWGVNTAAGAATLITRYEFPTPLNCVGKTWIVRAYIQDISKLTGFTLNLNSGAATSNTTTIGPLSIRAVDGGKIWDFVFGYGQAFDQIGTPDRTAMNRITIRGTSSGANVIRLMGVDYMSAIEGNPNKGVILETDDGDGTNDLMHAVLSSYNVPATVNMIAENMNEPNRLSRAQLKQWQRVDGWEIQAHAYYKTTQNFGLMSIPELEKELALLRMWGKREGFECDFVIYPQGVFSDAIREACAKFFRGGRTVYQTPFTPKGFRPFAIAAMSVQNTNSVADVLAYIKLAIDSGQTPHVVFHHWVEGGTPAGDPIGWGTNDLRSLVTQCLALGYKFTTYSEAYAK